MFAPGSWPFATSDVGRMSSAWMFGREVDGTERQRADFVVTAYMHEYLYRALT